MPKKVPERSALWVKNQASQAGGKHRFHAVGGVAGLQLQVKGGSSSWVLRTMVGDKRRDIGLGGYPDVGLSDAREKAREVRAKIVAGIDPVEERRSLRASLVSALSFNEAAAKLIAAKEHGWKNAKHADQWRNTLETYASPIIGGMPVDKIEIRHVEAVLSPIWATKTETASRVRMRIEAVLGWATALGYRSGDNPARWQDNLENLLASPGDVKKKRKHPALPLADMARFMRSLRDRSGAARALEFAILTAARSGEVRGATWSEIDLDAATWTVPADRMKAGKEHVVPLSPQAMALLDSLPKMAGTNLVFPSHKACEYSEDTLTKVMKLMHEADKKAGGPGFTDPGQNSVAVPHGFRSTFRDWAGDVSSYPSEMAEFALAHVISDKTAAAYRRGDMRVKRARMMADWADHIETEPRTDNVHHIRHKAS